jgi:Tfp pilus assembly protein PilN
MLSDDYFMLTGLIAELECAARVRCAPLVLRPEQWAWVEEVGYLLKDRAHLRTLVTTSIAEQRREGVDDEYETTLAALEEHLDVLTRRREWTAHAQKQYLETLRALIPDFALVSYEDEATVYTDLSLVYTWRRSMKEFREKVARRAPDIQRLLDQDTRSPNDPHERIECL